MASIDLRTEAKQIVDGLSDETLSIAVGLLTALKAQKPLQRADLLTVYPWARHLADRERDEFFDELASATKQARISGDWSAVDEAIDAWRETAEILGDKETMADITEAENEIDWLDTEYMEEARRDADDSITLESVRKALAKIPGSMSDLIISEREDRF